MTRRSERASSVRNERGSGAVEFAVIAPVLFGVIGMTLFSAHTYESRSEIQRAAERTALRAAVRCDPRGSYGAGSACGATEHFGVAELLAYASTQYHGVIFTDGGVACDVSPATPAVVCLTYTPTASAPTANQRVRVRIRFRSQIPVAPFLRGLSITQSIFNLEGRGEATVE
jgi:Flp pilus assembly protein TadG